ncbi:MAG TPA: hypothetical protein DHV16_07560 [Nitrospiraceae bacterium]|nr:MAG: hypothetical protein A2Z82_00585 [Nitrospirae bacterium GWA2_46_11]OGW24746.1 MAG: hypothetical protein A2X55_06970 [Nitrospirae bacterium GWB2_47_37]HAK88650.1 hypothetical protein [Nitrospiraceae bacterium]HCZ12094.1 hypothetical protein [Nitrospiraceae bacterium]
MARQIAVSFENETVKIVYASFKGRNLLIGKTLTLTNDEFEDFLKKEKSRDFIVVCDFKIFYQDIMLLPPVNEKYFKNIVEAEAKKRFSELKDFTFFHSILGERMHEGRRVKETFFFAVANDDLNRLVERFGRHGKRIRHIFPAPFALSKSVNSSYGITSEPLLCVAESDAGKTMFLMKDGMPHFIRTMQSPEKGIHDVDVQGINMTINYCRQTLRLSPSQVILIGTPCTIYDAVMEPAAPAICMRSMSDITTSGKREEPLDEFLAPISAIRHLKELPAFNLLPKDYRDFYLHKTVISYLLFTLLIILTAGAFYLKAKSSEIFASKKKAEAVRSEIKGMEPIITAYENKKKEMERFMPLINFINAVNASPDMQKALIAVSSLNYPGMRSINIRSINIIPEGNASRIGIKGSAPAKDLLEMQQAYQNLVVSFKNTKGIQMLSDRIDINSKEFQMELKYTEQSGTGAQR